MLIAAGYIVILLYVFCLIYLAGPLVQRRTDLETSRKMIHTMLFMAWVLIDLFFRHTIHQIVIPVIFLILNALSYKYRLYGSVEREEKNHMGTVYFAMAITAVMTAAYFVPALYLPSGAAAFCLTFGDGFAALVGYHVKSCRIRPGKTIAGFAACCLGSLAAMLVFRVSYWPDMPLGAVPLLALIAAIAELTENGMDNFTLTFAVFGAAGLMTLPQAGAAQSALWIACAVFAVVFLSRAITYAGSLLSMGIVFTFAYFGGVSGIGYLLATYFSIFFIGLLRRRVQPSRTHGHGRGFLQILVNGGLGTAAMVMYGATGLTGWMAVSFAAIGGCFIDSVSSDVGRLSHVRPYDLLRRQQVPTGLSGGVSALGTGAAAAFCVLITLYCRFAAGMDARTAMLVGVLSFTQTALDTVLGSLWQRKHRCEVCGELTEKAEHCGRVTVYASGVRWMDNNMVNLLSSLLTTALAAALLL